MKFDRPIVFFDIESTGTNTDEDKIIDIAFSKIDEEGTILASKNLTLRFNPGISIPNEASEVHGIYDTDVAGMDRFCEHAVEISEYISGCDLAGFNSNRFDVPLLFKELERCGIILDYQSINLLDVGNIFKLKEQRTLEAGVKFYLDRDHTGAHGALADTKATRDIFFEMLTKYTDLPESVSELAKYSNYDKPVLDIDGKFSTNKDGEYIYNFGKEKGNRVEDNLSYFDWMKKANFSPNTIAIGNMIVENIQNKNKLQTNLF